MIRKPECTCGSKFRSPSDILMAARLGILADEWHAIMDLLEETLDEVLDATHNMSDVEYFEYVKKLREEHGPNPE